MTGLEPEEAEEALEAALTASVLEEVADDRYTFRQALYARILGPRRRRLHRRAIEVLNGSQPPPLVQVAHHAGRLGDPAGWIPRAKAAADHAIAVGDDGIGADCCNSSARWQRAASTAAPRSVSPNIPTKTATSRHTANESRRQQSTGKPLLADRVRAPAAVLALAAAGWAITTTASDTPTPARPPPAGPAPAITPSTPSTQSTTPPSATPPTEPPAPTAQDSPTGRVAPPKPRRRTRSSARCRGCPLHPHGPPHCPWTLHAPRRPRRPPVLVPVRPSPALPSNSVSTRPLPAQGRWKHGSIGPTNRTEPKHRPADASPGWNEVADPPGKSRYRHIDGDVHACARRRDARAGC